MPKRKTDNQLFEFIEQQTPRGIIKSEIERGVGLEELEGIGYDIEDFLDPEATSGLTVARTAAEIAKDKTDHPSSRTEEDINNLKKKRKRLRPELKPISFDDSPPREFPSDLEEIAVSEVIDLVEIPEDIPIQPEMPASIRAEQEREYLGT